VGLIHRLDRNTSGVMVVAKRSKSAERLTAQLQDGRLIRRYMALLEGTLAPPGSELRWENWLIKSEATNETQALPISGSKPHPDAKKASLQVRVVKVLQLHSQPVSLCEFELETGRSHQIRAQSSAQGHPLVGDKKYGSRIPFTRPALHSHWIEFEHPISHERLQFECPWPRDLMELIGTGEPP
jgi:23S rRNA pseudouridine1911/1915/1917 synthase